MSDSPGPNALRSAPGTSWCIASAVLTLLTAVFPPFPFLFGVSCLISGWWASRAARLHPERFRGSAVPRAGLVLVLIGWSVALLFGVLFAAFGAAAKHNQTRADPPEAERF